MSSESHPRKWSTMRNALILTMCLLGALFLASGWEASGAAAQEEPFPVADLPTAALDAPFLSLSEAPRASFPASKIDAALLSLRSEGLGARSNGEGFAVTSDLRLENGRVQTRVLTIPGGQKAVAEAIREQGGEVTYVSESLAELQAWIPVGALETVAAERKVSAIQRPAIIVPLGETAVTAQSEGLIPLNAKAWHDVGQRGAGVKIAIIDGGFTGYPALLGSDLPVSVSVRNFVDGQNANDVASGTSHGTACAEIVSDIAPEAQLYLLKIATNIDLREAVDYAIAQGVDVISTSLGWYNLTPGDGSGQLADLAAKARANGIIWLTAAGNDRMAHWGGLYSDFDGDTFHNFAGTKEVNFYGPGGGTTAYVLPAGTFISIYLRWDDWFVPDEDFALHLVVYDSGQWFIVATSDRLQTGAPGQQPTEELIGTVSAEGIYGFVVQRKSGSRPVNLEIFAPDVDRLDELVPERSLANLADAPALVTVGAVDAIYPYAFQAYSGQGPTNGPGGTLNGGSVKPDLVAYTGVTTATYGARYFGGTSGSAPHAAGAAALVKGANGSLSVDDVRHILQSRAIDAGPLGLDTMFGYGRLYLGDPGSLRPRFDHHAYLPMVLK